MDFDSYQKAYFLSPQPEARFAFRENFGLTLYYQDFENAVAFYNQVLGSAGYQEGDSTRGWKIGDGWLTILRGTEGNPKNMEITFEMESPEQAERLQQAFIQAGSQGSAPSDQFMYAPMRICPATDPFDVDVMIFAVHR